MKTSREIKSKELADFKRLVECCVANPAWKRNFLEQPEAWLDRKGLLLDARLAVEVFAEETSDSEKKMENPYLTGLQEMINEVHEKIQKGVRAENIPDQRFRKWYLRQSRKYFFISAVSRQLSKGFYHIPFTFELSDGCSVGCPFCCFSAGKLKEVCRYTKEKGETWREILRISQKVAGDLVAMGICYMATEPFDNPDYELFLRDFKEVTGRYPQTTTAVAHRQGKRIRNFMNEIGEETLAVAGLRFSITSLEQLEEIHKCYTPWELRHVELIMNNPESGASYSKSGRSVELSEILTEKKFRDDISSACACGFVVNLAKKTITLEVPHKPDKKHPEGIKIFEECSFESSIDYQEKLEYLIEKWMPDVFPMEQRWKTVEGMSYTRKGYLLIVRGDGISCKLSMSEKEYQFFIRLIEESISLADIYRVENMNEFEKIQLQFKLSILYDKGCIEECE